MCRDAICDGSCYICTCRVLVLDLIGQSISRLCLCSIDEGRRFAYVYFLLRILTGWVRGLIGVVLVFSDLYYSIVVYAYTIVLIDSYLEAYCYFTTVLNILECPCELSVCECSAVIR